MVIVPNSKVKLIKNPLKLDSNNEMMFANATAQYNYFTSLPKLEFENLTYVRKDDVLRIPTDETGVGVTYEKLLQYNFCMYQNTSFGSKWFYAFIDDVKWINPSLTELHLRTAYYQSWQFDLVFADSFIEREHVDNDTIGLHTIPEGLELGDYVHAKQPGMLNSYDQYWICIGVTELPPAFSQTIQTNRVFNGIYSGLIYLVFKTANDATNFISACDSAGKADAINCLFMIPSSLCPNSSYIIGTIGDYTFEFTWIPNSSNETTLVATSSFNRPSYLDTDYSPKNNKLFTYPYSYCYVTNNSGIDVTYRYEDWNSGYPKFRIVGSISPGCSIRCYPIDYKGMSDLATTSNSYNYGINSGKFPICSWNSDVYTNWLTQQSVNMMLGDTKDYISLAGSVFTGNIGGAVSSFNNIIDRVAQKYEYSFTPNQAKGNTNSGDVTFSSEHLTFDIYFMSIKKEYAKIIDDFFNQFGYKVNRLGTPHLHVRTYYDYIKTIDVNIEGDVPETDLEEIRKMFNNGIRFWHNTSYYLNFSVNNTIIS